MKLHDLNDVCKNCGEYYGEHKVLDDSCPMRDDLFPQRLTGWEENKKFLLWEDE